MLFNSTIFLVGFLPLSLAGYFFVAQSNPSARLPVLFAISIVFYGYWDLRFVPFLLISILMNWLIASTFAESRRPIWITLAIVANLAALAAFKYLNFLAEIVSPWISIPKSDLVLPLGISFFTFHHIMYLTDLRRREAPRYSLVKYGLYIAFFPQVLAGPLVRWREIMFQFDRAPFDRPEWVEQAVRGLILLVVGLSKKALIADSLAPRVEQVFMSAAVGPITFAEAWEATLAFTLQIYFDFSGYTDMALGIAMMFGIHLPENFNAPYRATSLQDFWRRWHMTLSRFLRDYLYVPLGGNQHGLSIQMAALFTTMALGGLWHGASAMFIAWGCFHGVGLSAHLLWRRAGLQMPDTFAVVATLIFVTCGWVLFRAADTVTAVSVYRALFGFTEVGMMFNPILIFFSLVAAIFGPTSIEFVSKLHPRKTIAVATGVVFAALLLQIANGANNEFIYFQF